MTADPAIFWTIIVAGSVFIIILALWLFSWIASGAIFLLAFASAQGFVGFVTYAAAWVFLFPFMLVASAVAGWLVMRRDKVQLSEKNRSPNIPPKDFSEKYKWANRLPPYDK